VSRTKNVRNNTSRAILTAQVVAAKTTILLLMPATPASKKCPRGILFFLDPRFRFLSTTFLFDVDCPIGYVLRPHRTRSSWLVKFYSAEQEQVVAGVSRIYFGSCRPVIVDVSTSSVARSCNVRRSEWKPSSLFRYQSFLPVSPCQIQCCRPLTRVSSLCNPAGLSAFLDG